MDGSAARCGRLAKMQDLASAAARVGADRSDQSPISTRPFLTFRIALPC